MDKIVRDTIEVIEDSIKTMNKKKDLTPSDLETMCKAYELKMEIEGYYGDGDESYGRMDNMGMSKQMPHESMYYDANMNPHPMRSPVTGRYISRDEHGMSSHSIKDRVIQKLEEMYDEAKTDHEREEIRQEIRNFEVNR